MAKYYSLLQGTTTDTETQVAKENQIVIDYGSGMSQSHYVIYKVEHTADGYMYHMIDTNTKEIRRTDILRPYSQKFGIGMYYTDKPAEFMDVSRLPHLSGKPSGKRRRKPMQIRRPKPNTTVLRESGRSGWRTLCPKTCRG